MAILSSTNYDKVAYTHQGWLTEDHNLFLFGDESDELYKNVNTRTMIMNVKDLETPIVVGAYSGTTTAIDHNLYILGNHVYEANYANGLQVFEMGESIEQSADLTQVAQFDSYPEGQSATFNGAWSVYPYFPSGNIIISDINRGLFVVRVVQGEDPPVQADVGCYESENSCGFRRNTRGYYMSRPSVRIFCRRRCVPEDEIKSRLSNGWNCGRCRT